jgi:uncharacterized membrane protein YfcA
MFVTIQILLIIFFVAIIQSLFGVGVILIGTPILMLIGYDYFDVLSITLPTSLAISISQVFRYKNYINWTLFKEACFFTIPLIPFGMYFANILGPLISIIMGIFLLCTSFPKLLEKLLPTSSSDKRLKFVLSFMGFTHGLTSLGGGLLPSIVSQKTSLINNKIATTAAIYILFQITQISFILIMGNNFNLTNSFLAIITGFIAYSFFGSKLFYRITPLNYIKFLKYFIRIVAIFLIGFKIYFLIKN